MNGFLNDLRFGIRQLAAKPGFAAAAILTLALGIGANTAVFSVLSGYLFKPLPYPHGGRLVQIDTSLPKTENGNGYAHASIPEYLAIRKNTPAFSATAAYSRTFPYVRVNESPAVIPALIATPSLFDVLGIHPQIGRTFTSENTQRGRGHVAVISDHLWRTRFDHKPDIVGATFKMNGDVYHIVGVMPPGFAFPDKDVELWVPLMIGPKDKDPSRIFTAGFWLTVIGHLRPDATIDSLRQQLHTQARAYIARVTPPKQWSGQKDAGFTLVARPYHQVLVGDKTVSLWLLQGTVLLLLLITCVNVANLLLARIMGRSHEMVMRSALGATRHALARQLLIEGLYLVVPGGIAGVALGGLGLHFLTPSALSPGGGPFDLAIDWRVGLFALGAVCLTLILVSLLPLRHLARVDLNMALQAGGRTVTGGRSARRLRAALVAMQLTLATALLASSGLLLHSFVNHESMDTGYYKDNVLIAGMGAPQKFLSTAAVQDHFFSELQRRAKALPGVQSAAIAARTPLGHSGWGNCFNIRGRPRPVGKFQPCARRNAVGDAYFQTLGIPLLSGRDFDTHDTRKSQPVMIVDRKFARQYFPDGDAIGQQLKFNGDDDWYTIIGIVAPVQYADLTGSNEPLVYFNSHQQTNNTMALVMRTTVSPASLVEPLRKLVKSLNPDIAIFWADTMRQRLSSALSQQRTTTGLVLVFGGIALALAIVGVYGVMSYAAGQRRAECGIRLTLGALPEDLLWLIIKDGLKLLGIGLTAGLGIAVIFGFVLSSRLFGIAPYDPITLIGTIVVLAAITLLACYFPARRAAKLDPAVAMMEQ